MPYRPPPLPWSQSIILFGWWGLYLPLLVFLPVFVSVQLYGLRGGGIEFLLGGVLLPGGAVAAIGFMMYRMRRDLAEYRRLQAERAAEEFDDDERYDEEDEEYEEPDAFGTEYEPDDEDR